MKQLSIEEKAKRYDEIREKARKEYFIHEANNAIGIMDALERVFPEIKESEGERIRKEIIATIHLYYGEPLEDEAKEMIAWLEKQGKNNMGISEATKKKLEDNLNKALEKETPESWNEFLEKQGEQKQNFCHHEVDLSDCSDEYRKAYYDGWNNCNMQHSQCRSELDDVVKCLINGMKFYYEDDKEATWGTDKWSMPVKHIIEVLEKQCEQKPTVIIPKFRVGDEIKTSNEESLTITKIDEKGYWSEDLFICGFDDTDKWELVEQKPAWSEKDESNISELCSFIIETYRAEDASKLVIWLKSIKDRYNWKPSDEQMDALHYVTNFDYGGHKATLVSLYEQLKKLKGIKL